MATPGQAGNIRKEGDTDGVDEDTGAVERVEAPWHSMSLATVQTLREALAASYPSFEKEESEQLVALIVEEGKGALRFKGSCFEAKVEEQMNQMITKILGASEEGNKYADVVNLTYREVKNTSKVFTSIFLS
jgi:hypothetical protein